MPKINLKDNELIIIMDALYRYNDRCKDIQEAEIYARIIYKCLKLLRNTK